MNALDIYKKLPRTNCGECSPKTCMAFALSLLKGESELSGCPYLSEDEICQLKDSIKLSDWREELIRNLQEDVSNVPFDEIAEDIGATIQNDGIILGCLGREFFIRQDGSIETKGHITPWIKILILHYIKTCGKAPLSGKWVSYGELKSGMMKAASFQRDCEEPLRELFDTNFKKTSGVLSSLGAEKSDEFPTESAWNIYLLPRIPVGILYWAKEDEFESKAKILFDSSADKFLDAEAIIFLLEGLVKNIEMQISRSS
jgi:hypothetical protein